MSSSPDKFNILVVDDSRLMRRAIGKILKDHEITEGVDGEDGWNILSDNPEFDIVISDLSMPNLDGFGFLDIIRNSEVEEIRTVPVIVITGAEDDEVIKEKALSHGATDFITKPFDSVQLNARIKAHTESRKAALQLKQQTEALKQQTEQLDELKQNASVDPLTGLTNRNYFREHGNKSLAYAKRHRSELSIIRMDVDNFDRMFIKYGKDISNAMLKRVGEILKEVTRTEDIVSRIGVAKFSLILPATNRVGGQRIAERIREKFDHEIFEADEEKLKLTFSLGLCSPHINPNTDFSEIFEKAEYRLSLALDNGGNQLIFKDDLPDALQEAEAEVPTPAAPDLELAMTLIEQGKTDGISEHLPGLLKRILPLLEACNQKLGLNLDETINNLKNRLD